METITVKSSEENSSVNLTNPSEGNGLVISSNAPDYLVGRLLTLIEVLGLPESQERSIKDLVRNEVYKSITDGYGHKVTWIDASLRSLISELDKEMRKLPLPSVGVKTGFGIGDYTITYKAH